MPCVYDDVPGSWGSQSEGWPHIEDADGSVRRLVIREKLVPYGSYVTVGNHLRLETNDYVERVRIAMQSNAPQAAPVPVDTKPDPTKCYHKFPMDPRRCVLCGWDFRNGEPVPVEGTTRSGWIEAADRELINAHLGVANPGDTLEVATKKLGELIDFHVSVATDPAVNGGFKLVPVEGDSQPVAEVIEVASYPDSFNTVRWLKPVSVGTKLYATPPPSQPAVELEQFRPAVEALEREGRKSEVKDGVLHWTLNAKHYQAQELFALIDGAKAGTGGAHE